MDQDATPPGPSAKSDENAQPSPAVPAGVSAYLEPFGSLTPLVDPEDKRSSELAKPTRYPYTHSFWQEVLYAHQMGPTLAPHEETPYSEEPSVDEMADAPIAESGLPIRYVFRHCPTTLNSQGITQAWRETLADEAALQQQLSPSLFDRTAQVLSLDADDWPLHFCERRDISVQTMQGLTALLGWSAQDIEAYGREAASENVQVGAPEMRSTLPCRLVIVSGPPAYSGILLVAQQCLCDSQTLQYILVRFWRRYQGLPKLLPQWSDCFPDAKQAASCLNYWRELLVSSRFSPLPYDVSDRKTHSGEARLHTGFKPESVPAVNTTARFVTEEQWRLIQQASAVLSVDVESVMLSAFSRWLMQITQSESALFSVLAVRSPSAPVSPPELKPFSVQAGGNVAAGQWVESIAAQLQLSRQHAMPHLAKLAQSLGQSSYSLSQLLLETVFCFEYINVDWPEALAPITSFGNTNGQLGTHGRLQLTIDITEARMRLIWWGASSYISQAQLQAFEKSFDRTLMDLLRAVLQFNQWTCLEPPHKQPIMLSDHLASAMLPAELNHDNLLQQLQHWVSVAPDACLIATERRSVSRVVLWLAAAMFAHETLRGHPQFARGEAHHPVLILTEDPVAIMMLVVAAQMSLLVPMIVTVDARLTLLGDAHHQAWHQCALEWLLTTRQVTDAAAEHVVVVSVDIEQLLARAEEFVKMCQAHGVPIDAGKMMGRVDASHPVSGERPAGANVGKAALPPAGAAVWQSLETFFQSDVMRQAWAVADTAPILGYFDPIASVQCQRRIVTNSQYWRYQAQYLVQMADQSPGRFFQVIQVGQALDHAGHWPCIGALFAGAPLLWIMPETLLASSASETLPGPMPPGAQNSGAQDVGTLSDCVHAFLGLAQASSVTSAESLAPVKLAADAVARTATRMASHLIDSMLDTPVQTSKPLCFLPELCYALMVSEQRLAPVFDALEAQVRMILIGEGRLRLPASRGALPPTLLSVCEGEAVRAPVAHAGDTYTSAGRVLLGFVRPVPGAGGSGQSAAEDGLVLASLMPQIKASAAGNQRGLLDYCRSTLRLDIEGVWSVDMPRAADQRALHSAAAQSTVRRILRWELGSTVVLRGRLAPIIELEDRQFSPVGAWSAACRFWERIVSDCLNVGWVKVRPESQTLGQASVRIVPFEDPSIQSAMMAFARSAAWARIHTPAGRHWGAGVTPRWDEILGPKPVTAVAAPLAQSMTLARLTERILQLPATPSVSQTWAELGGDWFALFRLTFVLRRLGWTWTLPIRSLHQPLARYALQLVRAEQRPAERVSPPSHLSQHAQHLQSNRSQHVVQPGHGAPTRTLRPHSVHSFDLSAYQLGVFRRFPQSLVQQVYRLQFYYSGTMRAAQLRLALDRWVSLFPALTGFFELTGQGMQQRVLNGTSAETSDALMWPELLDQALYFQYEPFQSAYLEKLCLEDNCSQMQLSRPPLWRCVVYPKGQGRWSVWLMAHKLLFDSREWLDSIRCLELLLFEATDAHKMLPWLDTQIALRHQQMQTALRTPLQTPEQAQATGPQVLPAHVQASVARFWQLRLELACQPLVDVVADTPIQEDHLRTVIQPLPEALNGAQWHALVAGSGLDRLTLLLWAVVQGLMNERGLAAFRMDLDVPWSAMGAKAPEILTGQSGPIPLFLRREKSSTELPLMDFKQQLYDQLMAPNPECLLVPGNLAFEQFYDALFQQDVCFSYLESLPENTEVSSQADIEQLRRYWPCEFLESKTPYYLKIEAFPSRDRFMLAWRFDESLIPLTAVTAFVEAVDVALAGRLAQLSELQQSLAAHARLAAELTSSTELEDKGAYAKGAETKGAHRLKMALAKQKAASARDAQQALIKRQKQYWCPIDFGMSAWPQADWARFMKRFPDLTEVWQPMAVNAWAFKYSLSNPLAQCRGSQATRCNALPIEAFRERLKTLSLLVPEIAARWAVFPGGTVVLVKAAGKATVVRQVSSRAKWDALPPAAAHQDDQGLVLPCVFTLYHASQHTVLVRCDYDLRAFEPGLISALLATLAAGSLQPLKAALPKLWLANSGLGFPRLTRLQLNAHYQAQAHAGVLQGGVPDSGPSSMLPFQAYDQVRAAYWQHCFGPLVGAAHLRAWLPMTDAIANTTALREPGAIRQTTLNVISDQQCTLQDQTMALVCALQTIRRYLLRLWGDQHWVVHVLFADRASLREVGLKRHWAQNPNTSPHCWMPVYLGDGHVSVQDTENLMAQLQHSAQYPLESEAELCRWLGWPEEGVSDIVLVIADGDPKSAALQDWLRLQLAPLQFQWNPQSPALIHMAAHKGVALEGEGTAVNAAMGDEALFNALTLGQQLPLTLLAKQALHFPGVEQTQARVLDLARVAENIDDLSGLAKSEQGAAGQPVAEQARQLKILDVRLAHFPEVPGVVAHQIQNFLAARLNTALLPDLVRVCDARSWGEAGCYHWLAQLHGTYQSQLKARLNSVLFQSESATTLASSRADYRSWYWPVGEDLPGWQAERARASLLAVEESIQPEALCIRALRTMHHWAQWSDGGRRSRRQRGTKVAERRWELTPDQACWLAMNADAPGFFNARLLLHFADLDVDTLINALQALVLQDPIFRLQFCSPDDNQPEPSSSVISKSHPLQLYGLQQFARLSDARLLAAAIERVSLPAKSVEQVLDGITRVTHQWQSRFDLAKAPLVRLIVFDCGQHRGPYLALLGSRLAVDHRGLGQLALRLDGMLSGQVFSGVRSWQQWLAFLAQQRNQVRQLPVVSRLFSSGIRHGEECLYDRVCQVLNIPLSQLTASCFEYRHVRRQFLPAIDDSQAQSLCTVELGLQDARSVLCLSCLGLAFGSWLNLPEVVVGQWWPVRNDSRAQHWQEVVGSFEFVFKNKIMLMNDCPAETATRLFHYAPSALQDAISDALARDHVDTLDAFSLFSFERIDDQLTVPSYQHAQVVQHALGSNVAGQNFRRSLIRIEAAFGSGQLDLRWVYDRKLVPVSYIESLVTRFAFYWKVLRERLKAVTQALKAPPSYTPDETERVAQALLTQVPTVARALKTEEGADDGTQIENDQTVHDGQGKTEQAQQDPADHVAHARDESIQNYWQNLPYLDVPLAVAPCSMITGSTVKNAVKNQETRDAGSNINEECLPELFSNSLLDGSQMWAQLDVHTCLALFQRLIVETLGAGAFDRRTHQVHAPGAVAESMLVSENQYCASLLWALFLGQYRPLSRTVFGVAFDQHPLLACTAGTSDQGPLATYPLHFMEMDIEVSFRTLLKASYDNFRRWSDAVIVTSPSRIDALWTKANTALPSQQQQGSGLVFASRAKRGGGRKVSANKRSPFALMLHCSGEDLSDWALCFATHRFGGSAQKPTMQRVGASFLDTAQRVLASPDLPLQKVLPLLGSWLEEEAHTVHRAGGLPSKARLSPQNLEAAEALMDESLAASTFYDTLSADGVEDDQALSYPTPVSVDEEESI